MNREAIDIDALRFFVKGAQQNPDFDLEPVRVEASVRRYYRLHYQDSATNSVVLSTNPPFAAADDDFLVLSRFLADNTLPVPRILAVDESWGWILQSDAGENDLAERLSRNPAGDTSASNVAARRRILTETLDLLIQLHDLPLPDPVVSRHFDYDKLWGEIDFLLKEIRALCERHDAPSPLAFELEMFLQEVCGALEHEAKTNGEVFTHRDFHTRNIMTGDGLTLIDYQDARAGLPWYDLASLLWDPYTDFTAEERDFAYAYYVEKTGRRTKRAHDMYYAQALQRVFKALGTYLFQTYEKDQAVFYPSIGSALARIEEISQRGFFPDSVYLFVRHFQEGLLGRLPRPLTLSS